jgi:hypothetical protein
MRGHRAKQSAYQAMRLWLDWRFGDPPEAPPEPPRQPDPIDEAAQRAVEHRNQDSEHA